MKYTVEDIRKALIPVIGDGAATQKIMESFVTKKMPVIPSIDDTDKEIPKNHIVADSHDVLFRLIHISERGHHKCKSWEGNSVIDYGRADIRLATHKERAKYYKNQVEFLRTNIAPFLNYFHMRQLFHQLKDVEAKTEMSDELDKIEQNCFSKLQDIKKLW